MEIFDVLNGVTMAKDSIDGKKKMATGRVSYCALTDLKEIRLVLYVWSWQLITWMWLLWVTVIAPTAGFTVCMFKVIAC